MMQSKQVIAAGNICLDITPLFPPEKTGTPEELLIPGTLLRMDGADVHTGGSVANTGLAMKLFGADVRLLGKLGDDAFGRMILELLAQYGAETAESMIVSSDCVTSYSVVLAIPGTDRIFLHAPGANDEFGFDDIDLDAVSEAALFHLGYPPLMRRLYQDGGAELLRLFRAVHERGTLTSLDMAAVDPVSPAGQQDWHAILEALMPATDFFLPSAEELCFMLDRPLWAELTACGDVTALLTEEQLARFAEELIAMGVGCVVIKCGERGMLYRSSDANRMRSICERAGLRIGDWTEQAGFQSAFQASRLCSATGAGDVSIAAFLTAMLEGRALTDCIRLAAAAGAACVESYDALGALTSLDELETRFFAEAKE